MSKGYRTETNEALNDYRYNVFLPKLRQMIDEKIKEYRINGGKIICEQKNVVSQNGWKLNGLKLTGEKTYTIRVYADDTSDIADVVKVFNNKDKANDCFKFWKQELEM